MTDDPLQAAIAVVEAYLDRSMIPDPEGAALQSFFHNLEDLRTFLIRHDPRAPVKALDLAGEHVGNDVARPGLVKRIKGKSSRSST